VLDLIAPPQSDIYGLIEIPRPAKTDNPVARVQARDGPGELVIGQSWS